MIYIWICVALTCLMLLTPILASFFYYKTKKGEVLYINQDKVKQPRYFGLSFSAMVEKNLHTAKDGKIMLSHEEPYLDGDTTQTFATTVQTLVIAQKNPFTVPAHITFEKEIYSKNTLIAESDSALRAGYSGTNMVLGNNVDVMRWVDTCGTIAVYDHCDLGISASALRMSVGQDCTFRRLYAQQICLGQYPDAIGTPSGSDDARIYPIPMRNNEHKKATAINSEMVNEETGFVDETVVSWHNLNVTENIIVRGHLRSHKGVRVCANAIVAGNIFAEEDIIIEKGACVLGNVFTQGNVYLEEGATVGKQGILVSIIARGTITAEKNTFVYGFISCEGGGYVKGDKNETKQTDSFATLPMVSGATMLTFDSLQKYEDVDYEGYRYNETLETAIIPEGATRIKKSMFFHCTGLKEIVVPKSVEVIEDFAFADCTSLEKISLDGSVKSIGISAFEHCTSLREITFSPQIKVLDISAFSGCTALAQVHFPTGCRLEKVGEKCFHNCDKLVNLKLPEMIDEREPTAQ